MSFIDDDMILAEPIESLKLEISTVDAGDASSPGSQLFVNVVFDDGTRLYEPHNLQVGTVNQLAMTLVSVPSAGNSAEFDLPIPEFLERSLGDIDEVYVRKTGSNGWFVGSVLLFGNGHADPVIGSRDANQFLDNDRDVLHLRDWSTSSFCVATATDACHPLPRMGYRLLGPIIGQVGSTTATILYRVDREGRYRLRVRDMTTNATVFDQSADVEPTVRYEIDGLTPERDYSFDLSFVRASSERLVPDGAGSFRTYPPDGTPGRFAIAFGSCANPEKQVSQGTWNGIRSLATNPPAGVEPVRLFIHLGDSFYFYDHMTEEKPKNRESMHAAHVSMRRNIDFLDMARTVPCCGVWDDHDWAKDDTDSTDLSSALRDDAIELWRSYWGNTNPISTLDLGITTLVTHGLVDCYLLDGRSLRDSSAGVHFGDDLVRELLVSIRERGSQTGRVVVLATGSSWNRESDGEENYGDPVYDTERTRLFSGLRSLIGSAINGLVLLSGDDHINEIYRVDLGSGRSAPEFVSSPLTRNTSLKSARTIGGERVESFSSKGDKRGFTTLTFDTSAPIAEGNWTATVRYYREAATIVYHQRTYTVLGGQFI